MTHGLRRLAVGTLLVASLQVVPAEAETACDPKALRLATTPLATTFSFVAQDNVAVLATMPAAADVVAVGDSITRRWPAESLEKAFPGGGVFNYGMEGDRTQNILHRLSAPRLSRLQPRTVVLLIGTNNLADGHPACAIAGGIRAVVARIDALWAKPTLRIVEVLPRGERFDAYEADRRSVNAAIRELMSERGGGSVVTVDEPITCGHRPDCPNYDPDHVHLSAGGYDVLQNALAPMR